MNSVFTIAGRKESFSFTHSDQLLSSVEKKDYRLKIFTHLPSGCVPFHAVLLKKGQTGYLIVGKSGIGKSTLAHSLESLGYSIWANDMVVCWEEKGIVYAGDVNYVSNNKTKALPIEQFFFLTTDVRDRFVPNHVECEHFYTESLLPMRKKDLQTYTQTPLFKKIVQEKTVAFGNRISVNRWMQSFQDTVVKKSNRAVGIMGMGTVGKHVGSLLASESYLNALNVFSRNRNKLECEVLDLRSANTELPVRVCSDLCELIQGSDSVIVSFRSPQPKRIRPNEQERFFTCEKNLPILWSLSRVLRTNKFKGTIVMVTNPVDILSWVLYRYSNMNDDKTLDWQGLFSDQIIGIGLGLDFARMKLIEKNEVYVCGEHGDNILLAKRKAITLYPYSNERLKKFVTGFSAEVRKCTERTKYGPAHEIVRVLRVLQSQQGEMQVSGLQTNGLFLGDVFEYQHGSLRIKFQKSKKLLKQLQPTVQLHRDYQKQSIDLLRSRSWMHEL